MIEIESLADRSVRRRRRSVAVAVAAALIAGTGGFLVGRSTHNSPTGVGATPATRPRPTPTTDAPEAPAATSPDVLGAAGAPESSAPRPTSAAASAPALAAPGTGYADSKMAGAGGTGVYTINAYEEPQMQLLAERTTASGGVLRAHFTRYQGDMYTVGGPPGWAPAPWCYPQGSLRISIVAPQSVNLSYGPWYEQLKDGLSVTTFASGYVEGSPIFGAVAQVDPDVTKVTMTTASGRTDSTNPVSGIALLEVDGRIEQDITFTLTRADGTSSDVPVAQLVQPYSTPEFHLACDPPPPVLPDAGTPPADPVAAEAAIRANWGVAHDFAGDAQSRRSYVDDDTGVADAWKAIQNGEYADAAAKSTADIVELVFTSPTEAWFRYNLLTPITNFYDRYGIARMGADGVWVFTRQTVCQDIALAPGFGCTPPVDPLLPPSAATDPRYNPQPTGTGGSVGD